MAEITMTVFFAVKVEDDHPVLAEIAERKLVIDDPEISVRLVGMVLDVLKEIPEPVPLSVNDHVS